MIAGLEEVSQGDLYIGTRRVNDTPPRDRNIAMVFQNYALYPHLSVEENMEFSLKIRGVPRAERQQTVKEAAEILGIQELLLRKPKQLSGGQRQRVAMGRAIVRSPEVFLFDEPLSNLDAKLRVQMRVEIAKLHQRLKTTVVYVTHDQVEAMTLADRIVVMKGGIIQQIGSPMELYEKPANAFVGGFIGSPAMNQFVASLEEKNGKMCIVGQEIEIPLSCSLDKTLKPHLQHKILVGIRPNDLSPTLCSEQGQGKDSNSNGQVPLPAAIEVIEPMGRESYVYFTLENKQWIAQCEGMPPAKEGEKVFMVVDVDKLHLFTEDGEQRLA
jgi:multiple sugar transport system ATP-binding protein